MKPAESCFPESFDFYHLGRVRSTLSHVDANQAPLIVFFRLSGDTIGTVAVAFDATATAQHDLSTWVEMANVLASKFVCALAEEEGTEINLSPPELLQPGLLRERRLILALSRVFESSVSRSYECTVNGKPAVFRLAYLASPSGHA